MTARSAPRDIPLDHVRPDPDQPRKEFPPEDLDGLAKSIQEKGQLQTICVRPDPERGPGFWVIIFGERRYQALLRNGAPTVRAVVSDMPLREVRLVQLIENIQRADMTPLDEARAYQREIDGGMSIETLAKELGKKPWHISQRIALLGLRPEYQQLLATGNLSSGQAFEMARVGPRFQEALFRSIRAGQCTTSGALRAAAAALIEGEAQDLLFGDDLPPAPSAEEQEALSSLERKITQVCGILAGGFHDNQIVIARKIDPDRAATYADKLALIRRHLSQLENALRAGAAVGGDLLSRHDLPAAHA